MDGCGIERRLREHRAVPHLWRGMILQAKGDFVAAIGAYNASSRRAEPFDWQGTYRLWRLLCDMGATAAAEVERAATEAAREGLEAWGYPPAVTLR